MPNVNTPTLLLLLFSYLFPTLAAPAAYPPTDAVFLDPSDLHSPTYHCAFGLVRCCQWTGTTNSTDGVVSLMRVGLDPSTVPYGIMGSYCQATTAACPITPLCCSHASYGGLIVLGCSEAQALPPTPHSH